MPFMKNTLMLFGTISITLFLVFPVSLYTVSSLDKKFILAPVKVQPEKHWARSSASGRGRHVGLKTPSIRQAAPFCLYLWAQAFWKRVSALTRPSKESGISSHQKPSDGGCYTPQRNLSLPSCGETRGLAISVLNMSSHEARDVAMYSATQATQGVPQLLK